MVQVAWGMTSLELVQATTRNDLRLDGLWEAPLSEPKGAVILLHGVGGNFYGSALLRDLAAALRSDGWAVLRANTRGHDLVSLAQVGGRARYEGAAFETVSRCTRDLAAWNAFCRSRGARSTVILGHSLGAIKALYAAVHDEDACPDAVIALSPPRLSYAAFAAGAARETFLDDYERARQAVIAGRAREIMSVRFPFPLLLTPATFLDKYGPEERYNIERFVGRLAVPSMLLYGELELRDGGAAFSGLVESLAALEYSGPEPHLQTIVGADHFYTGRHGEAAQAVSSWLRDLRLSKAQ